MSTLRFDTGGIRSLQKQLNELDADKNVFYEAALKELAARLLRKVIMRTPVGQKPTDLDEIAATYWDNYNGGTLRRGWTAKTESEAEKGSEVSIQDCVYDLKIERTGNVYAVTIINCVHYAADVEYGHRQEPGRFVPALGKRLKKPFVQGLYMLTISENELERQAPTILKQKLENFIRGAVNGK